VGTLDHRRTWQYEVNASPSECIRAFAQAFSGRGGLVSGGKWDVTTNSSSATAIYQGRRGLGALASIASQTSSQEADTAVGSEVKFTVEGNDGQSSCVMWLESSGRSGIAGMLGSTSDARFIRPHMQAVAREIKKLDPAALITKGN
jgi:hypothetical protein